MNKSFIISCDNGRFKIPADEKLFISNYDYFHGMGIFDEATCLEKALQLTGFRFVDIEDYERASPKDTL